MFYSPHGRYLCLCLSLAVAAVHMFYPKRKNLTKGFLLPTILLYYLTSVPRPSAAVCFALAFGWLGDVLLTRDSMTFFTLGGCAFMLNHALFSIAYARSISFLPKVVLFSLSLYIVCLCAAGFIIHLIKPYKKNMLLPLYLYLAVNATMNFFAFMRLLSVPGLACGLTVAGALLFFFSDCYLFIGCFYEKKRYNTFLPVIASYIFGELLITQGFILLP